MTEEEARKLLGSIGTNAVTGAARQIGDPVAGAATGEATGVNLGASGVAAPRRAATFEERNRVPGGPPVDTTEGLPALVRFNVGLRDRPEQKIEYLDSVYGRGASRMADDGTPLVRIKGADNVAKDVTVNDKGLSFDDIAGLAAYVPDIAGSILAIRGAKAIPGIGKMGGPASGRLSRLAGFGRDVTAEAVGQETGGAVRDVATGVNPGDIAADRARNIPMDMTASALMGVAGKVIGKAITPFGSANTEIGKDLLEGKAYMQERFGIDYPLTTGEITDVSFFKRGEAYMGRQAGASAIMDEVKAQKTAKFRQMMNKIMGLGGDATEAERASLPNTESVGAFAIDRLKNAVDPVKASAELAQQGLSDAVTSKVMQEVTQATGMRVSLTPGDTGGAIRTKFFQIRDAFKDEDKRLYNHAYGLPGGSDRVLTAPSLPAEAQRLLKALPPKDEIISEPTGLLDQFGSEGIRTRTGSTPNKQFIPDGVIGKLESLANLGDTKLSLKDLVAMRSDVYNDIATGEALPGVKAHHLREVVDVLNNSIDEAVAPLPNGELKAAWLKANAHHKGGAKVLNQGPIARLFKTIEDRGFVQNEDIVRNIGETEYNTFKSVLGEASPEFKLLKRGMLDELVNRSTPVGSSLVDGQAFIQELNAFYKKDRSVANDVLGTKGAYLARLGELQAASKGEGSLINPDKFRDLLSRGDSVNSALDQLLTEQDKLTKMYKSKIIKDIADGKLGESFDSGEFVNRYYKDASVDELKEIALHIRGTPHEAELKRKVIERMFFDAQRAVTEMDPSNLGRGGLARPSSATKLDAIFKDGDQKERLEIILGKETYKDFEQFAKILRSGEVSEKAFSSAGGISAGQQVSSLTHGQIATYAPGWVKERFAALLLTMPKAKEWLSNTRMTPEEQAIMTRAFIASTPFMEAAHQEFHGDDTMFNGFFSTLLGSINRFEQYGPNAEGRVQETTEQKRARMEKLLKGAAGVVRPIP